MTNAPLLSLQEVTQRFHIDRGGEIIALDRISLDVRPGEFLVLVGPSGSGKSTLLRIMSGLESPTSGRVEFGSGLDRLDQSFVFQQFALLPWLTVAENIGLGLLARGRARMEREHRVREAIAQFDLQQFRDAHPRELSGGMRQRVGLARAFVTDPKIIFMDEPFSELDSFTAEELRAELLATWTARRVTIVMVTHIVEEALELADRIAVLTPRPGRIEAIVENALPRPRMARSPEFFAFEDRIRSLIRP